MSRKLGINTLLILILTVLFYLFFMHAKHDPALSAANAFAEDPFDAVGSFGVQVVAFLGALASIRALRLVWRSALPDEQQVLLARTQMLAVLAVVVTLGGDAVATARYPSLWIGSPGGPRLVALAGSLALFAAVAGVLVYRSVRAIPVQAIPNAGKRAAVLSLAGVAILVLYPDTMRQSIPGALLTALVGAVLLFALMWAWGAVLVPYHTQEEQHRARMASRWPSPRLYRLGLILLVGFLVGFSLVLAEFLVEPGDGQMSLARMAFVACTYMGLEAAGFLIGYGFLEKPLGLSY